METGRSSKGQVWQEKVAELTAFAHSLKGNPLSEQSIEARIWLMRPCLIPLDSPLPSQLPCMM